MNRFPRPLIAATSAAALAVALSACGASPTDASTDEFCEVANDQSWVFGIEEGDYEGFAKAIHDYAERLEEVGTPDDIPDDAREGFQIQVEAAKDVTAEDLEKVDTAAADDPFDIDLSEADAAKVRAYTEYQVKACGGLDLDDLPTDLPTDLGIE
ncbi:hypothetical protein [Nocardioides sp. YIM 152588]|uniref:hypothetical protein n=1 Tax=Nocardioides sp. YIM 152588 TaxID=3158259 RepID=UPI0032E46531